MLFWLLCHLKFFRCALLFFSSPPCAARLVRRDGHPSSNRVNQTRPYRHTQQHRPRPAELRGFCGLLYYRVVSLSFLMGALLFPRVLCLCVWGGVPAAPITCTVGCNVFMCVRRLYLDNISESKMGETTGSKRHTRLTLNGKKKMMIIIIIINSSSELVIS